MACAHVGYVGAQRTRRFISLLNVVAAIVVPGGPFDTASIPRNLTRSGLKRRVEKYRWSPDLAPKVGANRGSTASKTCTVKDRSLKVPIPRTHTHTRTPNGDAILILCRTPRTQRIHCQIKTTIVPTIYNRLDTKSIFRPVDFYILHLIQFVMHIHKFSHYMIIDIIVESPMVFVLASHM
jgi:hypothetical protein